MTVFGLLWLVLVLVVLGYEGYAIFSRRSGDTLSEQVWGLVRHSKAATGVIMATLVWLLWHFLIEPRFFPGLHLSEFNDDIGLAVLFSIVGWSMGPIRTAGRTQKGA